MAYKQLKGGRTTWTALARLNGKRRCRTGLKSKKEALDLESQFRREILLETETGTVSLGLIDWANKYLDFADRKFVKSTMNEKRAAFQLFFKVVEPGMDVENLLIADVLGYLEEQADCRSGYAANKDRKNLRAAWAWGVKYLKLPKDNPFAEVEKFSEERRPRYVPPEEDFWAVYEAAEVEQDRVMLLGYLHTAARRSELLRLTWSDIDFARGLIRLGTRKRSGGSMEYDNIPMTKMLREALLKQRMGSRSEFVFVRENGKPYKWRQHWLNYLCGVAGVRKFGIHAIRHLSASILAREGIDIPRIQAILRHRSPTTTAGYIKQIGGVEDVLEQVFGERGQVIPFRKKKALEAATSRA